MYRVSGELIMVLISIWWLVAKVGEKLAVIKPAAQRFDGEKFNLRKLNELEVRKQY